MSNHQPGSSDWLRAEAKTQAGLHHLFHDDEDKEGSKETKKRILALRDAANHIDELTDFVFRLSRQIRIGHPKNSVARLAMDYVKTYKLNGTGDGK